jgi:mannose-1-phosphate guanylyltransferase
MPALDSHWTIVLAAGDGVRLASLTAGHAGQTVPKQFCSLRGGQTLLGDALVRARAITPSERIVASVAEKHRPYWIDELECLPPENVLVQPSNRGTAVGLLLPLLAILERDPAACVAILPSDHHVREEAVLRVALLLALQYAQRHTSAICMLGMSPDSASSDYGWILPQPGESTLHRVDSFMEKPEPGLASVLLQQGALWNSFILAGTGQAFAALYQQRLPALLCALSAVRRVHPGMRDGELRRVYDELSPLDFSREVLQGSEAQLRVLEVPPCGWTDLGTPRRVAQCLHTGHYGRQAPALSDDTPVLFERLAALRRRIRSERRQRTQRAS